MSRKKGKRKNKAKRSESRLQAYCRLFLLPCALISLYFFFLALAAASSCVCGCFSGAVPRVLCLCVCFSLSLSEPPIDIAGKRKRERQGRAHYYQCSSSFGLAAWPRGTFEHTHNSVCVPLSLTVREWLYLCKCLSPGRACARPG